MQIDALLLVAIAANVLGAAMALPQAVKTVTLRTVAGVSPAWAGISAATNAAWGVYGWGVGDWSIVPVSAFSVMTYLLIATAVVRLTPGARRRIAGPMVGAGAVALVVPFVTVLVAGWGTAGVVLGAMYGIQLSPAVAAVYRVHDVSGVSIATWVMALVEAVLWAVYGTARLDSGLITLGVIGSVMSSLVLVRLVVKRPRRSRDMGFALAPA